MTIKLTRNIFTLSRVWNEILKKNKRLKPTQSFEYYIFLYLTFYARISRIKRYRIVFLYYREEQCECIIPLIINNKSHEINSISCFGRLDYDDIISSTTSPEFIRKVINVIAKQFPGYTLLWQNINEDSILYSILKSKIIFQEPCVKIELPLTYSDYYLSISKSQRQNIRTAYNRVERDGIDIVLKIYDHNNPLRGNIWTKCENMYELRHNIQSSNLFFNYINRIRNAYHHVLNRHPLRKIFVLFSNDTPIAYMAGLVDIEKKNYYVPRLCINEIYKKYSPGIILLNETIKYLISKGYNCIDLMKGEEQYKYSMGGTMHSNYYLNLSLDNLKEYVTYTT